MLSGLALGAPAAEKLAQRRRRLWSHDLPARPHLSEISRGSAAGPILGPMSEPAPFRDRIGVLKPLRVRDFRLMWTGLAVSMVTELRHQALQLLGAVACRLSRAPVGTPSDRLAEEDEAVTGVLDLSLVRRIPDERVAGRHGLTSLEPQLAGDGASMIRFAGDGGSREHRCGRQVCRAATRRARLPPPPASRRSAIPWRSGGTAVRSKPTPASRTNTAMPSCPLSA